MKQGILGLRRSKLPQICQVDSRLPLINVLLKEICERLMASAQRRQKWVIILHFLNGHEQTTPYLHRPTS